MSIIPRGQVSTILLGALAGGDKYGAQILSELQKDNEITIKQPTLYSTLSRMEKQGLISSYWRDSDIGGKRHYYSLTDLGKKTLQDAENIILSENEQKKYYENEGFQKESAQLDTPSNSSYFENAQNPEKNSFFENEQTKIEEPQKDDGRFLTPDEVYYIPTATQENITKSAGLENEDDQPAAEIIDNGVFITESVSAESLPKVKKMDVAVLDIKSEKEFNFSPPQVQETYKDKIQDLYQKTRENTLSRTYQAEMTEYSTTGELQKRYDDMQIKFYAHDANNQEIVNNYGKIPTIKLFAKYFTIFLLIALESLAVWLGYYLQFGSVPYAIAYIFPPLLFAIFPIYYLASKNKYKKIYKKNSAIWLSILIFVVGIAAVYSLNLLFGITPATILAYPTTFIYPCVLLTNFLVAAIFDMVYCKKYC